jgi:hypothetical protein
LAENGRRHRDRRADAKQKMEDFFLQWVDSSHFTPKCNRFFVR